MNQEELVLYIKKTFKISDKELSKWLTTYYQLGAFATGKAELREANKFNSQTQIDALNAGAEAKDAIKFTSQLQIEALRAGAEATDAVKFNSQTQIDALNAGAEAKDAIKFTTDYQVDALESGLFSVSETLKMKSSSEVRNNNVSQTLLNNGVFSESVQANAYSSGKINVQEAKQFTTNEQVEALAYPAIQSAEDALKINDSLKLAAIKTNVITVDQALRISKSYVVSLLASGAIPDEQIDEALDVKNYYTYKVISAGADNITVAEAKKLNTWYKYNAFMTGKVNATAAALFDGPKYNLLVNTELSVDEILNYNTYDQVKAVKTGKVTNEEALQISNNCQILALLFIESPEISLVKQLSSSCSLNYAFKTCQIQDNLDESVFVSGDCSYDFLKKFPFH